MTILVLGLTALCLGLVGAVISLRRRLRGLDAFAAERDTVTDLPDRALFGRRVRAALSLPARDGRATAIAVVGVEPSEELPGAERLRDELGRRLALRTRPGDTVARLAGDAFGIVLTNAADPGAVLTRLRAVVIEDAEVSVGYVVAPEDGVDVDDLLQRADVAMYTARAQHGGVVRYNPSQDGYDAGDVELIADLRGAIAAGQLVLHYQPKAMLADGRVEAVEALLRWQHPSRGFLFPAVFLPLAEQSGLIDELTEWVLAQALSDVRELGRSASASGLRVAVNVSARNLARPDFRDRVVSVLGRVGVAPDRLIIEVTEAALVVDPDRTSAALRSLHEAGVQVSLDDFGRGQTSLGFLATLQIDELKVDRNFVGDMASNPAHAAAVRSIVGLGHSLDVRVVAVGVESENVLASLRSVECDAAQGFLLARPMPVDQLWQWLALTRQAGVWDAETRGRRLVGR